MKEDDPPFFESGHHCIRCGVKLTRANWVDEMTCAKCDKKSSEERKTEVRNGIQTRLDEYSNPKSKSTDQEF